MSWLEPAELGPAVRRLYDELRGDGVILDLSDSRTLGRLRADVERIADGMEKQENAPPMLWTGIPFPRRATELTSDYCLVVSVGGTKTNYALMRMEKGVVYILDREGKEVSGPEVAEVKKTFRMPTPTQFDTRSGMEMIEKIVDHIGAYLQSQPQILARCQHVLLSWGFAHSVFRTREEVLGGVAARASDLTKDQAGFTQDLRGKDIGQLFRDAFEKRLQWSRPVTVANDGIMALHYFLTTDNLTSHAQFGLFINGTGTNFAMAEQYAVRPQGVVSRSGEEYQPARVTRCRSLRHGEKLERYFVNYESGSIDLIGTRTRYDQPSDYPIETNALAGGNAFEQQFREIVRLRLGEPLYARLLASGRLLESWRRQERGTRFPRGPEVSRLAGEGRAAMEEIFPGAGLDGETQEKLTLVCRAIVNRSALHAALVLAAVTRHLSFGLGEAEGDHGRKPDLLATEGSVWNTPRYRMLVHGYWNELVGGKLAVDFDHERNYDASLAGPLYLAALHR